MERLILVLLLSVFSFGVYAQGSESPYSVISHRQYGTQDSYNAYNQSQYGGIYQTSSRSAHYGAEQSDGYQSSYRSGDMYQDRVSANTFSNTPSMEITTMLPSVDESNNGYGGRRRSSGVRPPQRGVDDDDKTDPEIKEPDTNDPNATPLGDTPWLLMLLLAGGYAIYVGKKQVI